MLNLTRPLSTLLVAAALAVGLAALLPGSSEAGPGIQCFCPPSNSEVAHGWAMGHATCAQARAACQVDAQGKAHNYCSSTYGTSVCSFGSINFYPSSCLPDGSGGFKVDCDQYFACEQCIDLRG